MRGFVGRALPGGGRPGPPSPAGHREVSLTRPSSVRRCPLSRTPLTRQPSVAGGPIITRTSSAAQTRSRAYRTGLFHRSRGRPRWVGGTGSKGLLGAAGARSQSEYRDSDCGPLRADRLCHFRPVTTYAVSPRRPPGAPWAHGRRRSEPASVRTT